MADKTTGELDSVKVGDLPAAPDIYDDFKMPGELQGDAVHVTGAQLKGYAVAAGEQAVRELVDSAAASSEAAGAFAESAEGSAEAAESAAYKANKASISAQTALSGVQEALDSLPEGDTLIINDLSTGGASAALSAEMGKMLASRDTENLLDNSDLTNVVNQRGLLVYAENKLGYCVDRWARAQKLTVEVESDGITLTNTGAVMNGLYQLIDPDRRLAVGEIVTLACEDGDGNVYVGSAAVPAADYVQIISVGGYAYGRIYAPDEYGLIRAQLSVRVEQSFKLRWIALYRGSYTVDTLPPFRPRGYNEELRRCQQYFQVVNAQRKADAHLLDVRAGSSTTAVGTLPLSVPMRAVPAVSFSGEVAQVEISDGYLISFEPISAIAVSGDNCDTDRLRLEVSISGTNFKFSNGEWYEILSTISGNVGHTTAIYLDANL